MNIEEVVHLLLFNLTLQFRKRYYNLTNVIYPYARDNWLALQLPPKVSSIKTLVFVHSLQNSLLILILIQFGNCLLIQLKNMTLSDVKDEILKALKAHTDRFKPGSEIKKKIVSWALVSRTPPKAPYIALSPGPPLTEKYINDLFKDEAKIDFIPQNM